MEHPILFLDLLFGKFGLHIPPHLTYAVLVSLILFGLGWLSGRHLTVVPTGAQNVSELIVGGLEEFMVEITGEEGRAFFPYIGTAFIFILVCNLIGLIPGFLSPTSNVNTTLSFALCTFVYTHYLGIKFHGVKYIKHFLGPIPRLAPLFLPIGLVYNRNVRGVPTGAVQVRGVLRQVAHAVHRGKLSRKVHGAAQGEVALRVWLQFEDQRRSWVVHALPALANVQVRAVALEGPRRLEPGDAHHDLPAGLCRRWVGRWYPAQGDDLLLAWRRLSQIASERDHDAVNGVSDAPVELVSNEFEVLVGERREQLSECHRHLYLNT